MGAFRPPVGALDRSEELRLQSVRVVLVELLVRGAEIGEREPDLCDGLCQSISQLLLRFLARIRHLAGRRAYAMRMSFLFTNSSAP